jgi:hypothetical protein
MPRLPAFLTERVASYYDGRFIRMQRIERICADRSVRRYGSSWRGRDLLGTAELQLKTTCPGLSAVRLSAAG